MGDRSKVLVLCLGNDFLSDDGVGWAVADALEDAGLPENVVLKRSAVAGFYLLDDIEEHEEVVVVDAVRTGLRPPGTVLSLPLEALHTHAGPSPHSVGLPAVLEVARRSGVAVPGRVHLVVVEAEDLETLGGGLSRSVRQAVPEAAAAALAAARRSRGAGP